MKQVFFKLVEQENLLTRIHTFFRIRENVKLISEVFQQLKARPSSIFLK